MEKRNKFWCPFGVNNVNCFLVFILSTSTWTWTREWRIWE